MMKEVVSKSQLSNSQINAIETLKRAFVNRFYICCDGEFKSEYMEISTEDSGTVLVHLAIGRYGDGEATTHMLSVLVGRKGSFFTKRCNKHYYKSVADVVDKCAVEW